LLSRERKEVGCLEKFPSYPLISPLTPPHALDTLETVAMGRMLLPPLDFPSVGDSPSHSKRTLFIIKDFRQN
jgi:hypothetical protein